MVLTFIGGAEIGDGIGDSGDWGLYSSSARITVIVANTLNELGGKLRSLRLGGTFECWLPNTYEIVGSLESESIVTIRGSREAMEEIVIFYFAIAPDSSVELRNAWILFLIGLLSFDERSTYKTTDSVVEESKEEIGFIAINCRRQGSLREDMSCWIRWSYLKRWWNKQKSVGMRRQAGDALKFPR